MLQSVLLILLIIAAFWGLAHIKQKPPGVRRKLFVRSAVGALVVLLIAMAVTGRMHWLFALVGALLPFVRGLFGIGLQFLPLWLRRRQTGNQHNSDHNAHNSTQSPPNKNALDVREAMDILGLEGDIHKGDISTKMINDAHRRLIQKMHPDRGGSDYLAAKINQARDLLLSLIKP